MSGGSIFIALAGAQLALLSLLGLNTSLTRGKFKVPGAYDEKDEKYARLYAAQRAHGNQSEWGPAFAVMFLGCHLVGDAPAWVSAVAVWATAGRILMSYALAFTESLKKPTLLRRIGGLSTYLTGTSLSLYLVSTYWN